MHPRKNIVNLLLAFDRFIERLKQEGYRSALPKFLLAGRAAFETDAIFKTYEKLINKKLVEIKGMVNEQEKWQLLAEATCMCYISKWEGFGIPILEAMHAETPVITSNSGAQFEVAGKATLVAAPQSIDEITEKMYELYTDKTLQKNLISKGKERVKAFNWEETSEIIYRELQKLHDK
jgi:glycosyltransferase involved in cell wall biosynthesis